MGYYDDTEVGKQNKKAPKPKREKDEAFEFALIGTVTFTAVFALFFGFIYFFDWFVRFADKLFK